MAVYVLGAFPSIAVCQCVDADCGVVSMPVKANALRCHRVATQAKERDPSRKECCGKCQIEKAAVLSHEFFTSGDVRSKNTFIEMDPWGGFYSKIQPPSFFQKGFSESPPGFFIQSILNTTLSSRAPPQG